uniref:Uncharacterized protein n=1 Tax=Graphocephala atropunctata TaxID=36148 RepID=A0A1B6MJ13_9HEMI
MSADILQARREARRRKILENSENRLRRITGKSEIKENIGEGEEEKYAATEVILNGRVDYEKKDCSYLPSPVQIAGDFLPAGNTHAEQSNSTLPDISVEEEPVSSQSSNQQPSNLLYISIAMLLRLLLELDSLSFCGNSMVVAFLILKCTFIGVYGLSIPETSRFLGSLLVLSGISPQKNKTADTFYNHYI